MGCIEARPISANEIPTDVVQSDKTSADYNGKLTDPRVRSRTNGISLNVKRNQTIMSTVSSSTSNVHRLPNPSPSNANVPPNRQSESLRYSGSALTTQTPLSTNRSPIVGKRLTPNRAKMELISQSSSVATNIKSSSPRIVVSPPPQETVKKRSPRVATPLHEIIMELPQHADSPKVKSDELRIACCDYATFTEKIRSELIENIGSPPPTNRPLLLMPGEIDDVRSLPPALILPSPSTPAPPILCND